MTAFSTSDQLREMQRILASYVRLPSVQASIPGQLMESILAYVHNGTVLNTYDFADVVVSQSGYGWQVKSTKEGTPVTWKRAKIPNATELIEASQHSRGGLQELGDSIIAFCNEHARASLLRYNLEGIAYSRLILHKDRRVTYFERFLCSQRSPDIFDPTEFEWNWSTPKTTVAKEQLPALHGVNRTTGKKWWAWHGRGENQLHFSGESEWWPTQDNPHMFSFQLPPEDDKLSFSDLTALLTALDA